MEFIHFRKAFLTLVQTRLFVLIGLIKPIFFNHLFNQGFICIIKIFI